ncbi:MAG: PAS domain S-box protein [Thermodesulfovibrionales bacterium]
MDDLDKPREQLTHELETMRRNQEQLEACRKEFESTRERYEKLLNAAPDAMIFADQDSKIVLVNAQTEKLFGYTQTELVGKKVEVLIPERFRQVHHHLVANYFESPKVRSMGSDLRIYGRKKDSSEFRADISLSPMRIEGTVLVVAAVRDVTERVQAQEQIERNYHIQKVINSLLKSSLDPIPLDAQLENALNQILSVPYLALRSKGSIYLVEGESKELVLKAARGMTEGELADCQRVPLGRCLCGKAAATCEVVFADCVDEGHEIRFADIFPHGHYCVPIASGGKPLGVINVYVQQWHKREPIEEGFLSTVGHTLAGVIERHLTESDKQRLQEQLVQSEKLAALGRIAANVAHEIRNPLTSVGGFARRLQKRFQERTAEREYADFIVSEVTVLENVLRDVLTYSRASVLRIEEQDIHAVVDAALLIYEEACRAHGIMIRRSYGDVPKISLDKEQVIEVIGNLFLNAIDAMPTGGTLTVATDQALLRDVTYCAIHLMDTGEGITEEILDKIFEPFFTTKVAKRGIGLGLPISKKIVEDHGGFITVSSTVGKGSTFSIYFPCRPKPS